MENNKSPDIVLCGQCPLNLVCESAQPDYYAEKNVCPLWVMVKWLDVQKYGNNMGTEERQAVVLKMIVQGYKTKEIADTLLKSVPTIKRDVKELCSKFYAKNRSNLSALAVQSGAVRIPNLAGESKIDSTQVSLS
jgi:DNA-binding CsgD family transcriptional regulator